MGSFEIHADIRDLSPANHLSFSLLSVGETVDEAAFLFYSLEQACHSQLLADAAAANGAPKQIIPANIAQYTADAVQSPVRRFQA